MEEAVPDQMPFTVSPVLVLSSVTWPHNLENTCPRGPDTLDCTHSPARPQISVMVVKAFSALVPVLSHLSPTSRSFSHR